MRQFLWLPGVKALDQRRSVLVGLLLSAALAAGALVTDVRPIALHAGANVLDGFAPDGGQTTIVQIWSDNGSAYGRNTWLVMTRDPDGPFRPAAFGRDGRFVHLVHNDPSDCIRRVVFAFAKLNGAPVGVMIDARLEEASRPADRAQAFIRVYELVQAPTPGDSTEEFAIVEVIHPAKRYCNVDFALRDVLGIALPDGFSAANRINGCDQ